MLNFSVETFGERLKTLRIRANLTQKSLAELARVAPGTVVTFEKAKEKGRTTVTYRPIVESLAKSLGMTYDEVDGFLTGPLPELRDAIKEIESKPPSPEWQHAMMGPRIQQLPDIPIVAQVPAGAVSAPNTPTEIVGTIPRGIFPHDPNAFGLEVHGDSMTPYINDRDLVIASPAVAHGPDGFPEGTCCVIIFREPGGEHRECLKFVFREKDGRLKLVPRNENHPTRIVEARDVEVIPVVVRIFRDWLRTGVTIPVVPGRGQGGPVTFAKPEDVPQKAPSYDGGQEHPDYDTPVKIDPTKAVPPPAKVKLGRPKR